MRITKILRFQTGVKDNKRHLFKIIIVQIQLYYKTLGKIYNITLSIILVYNISSKNLVAQ